MKPQILGLFVLTILALSIVSTTDFCVVKAQSAGAVNILADGSITGTDKLQRNGDTYIFLDNILASAFYVRKSNVVIDGSGYTFNSDRVGDNLSSRGIVLSEVENVTVKNLKATGGYTNIQLDRASNCTIFANELIENFGYAIMASKSTGNRIENNTITGSYNGGIRLFNSIDNIVVQNVIKNNGNGIYLDHSTSNVFRNNTLQDNVAFSSNFKIDWGQISDFYNDVDSSNTIDGRPIYYWQNTKDKTVPPDASQVILVNCTRITAKDLTAQGIMLASTTYSTVANVTVEDKGNIGIVLIQSSENTVSNCYLKLNTRGLHLESSSHNTITECAIACRRGLNFVQSDYNQILRNNFTESEYAVEHFSIWTSPYEQVTSKGNTFEDNNFANNVVALTVGSNYVVSGNRFIGNRQALLFQGGDNSLTGNYFANNYLAMYLTEADNKLRSNQMENNAENLVIGGLELTSSYLGYTPIRIYANDIDTSNMVNGKPVYFWVDQKDKTVPLDAAFVVLIRCTNITVQNLNISESPQGIVLFNTHDSTIKQNSLTGNTLGIGLFGAYDNTIMENYLTKNLLAIRIDGASSNKIINNTLAENKGFAMVFSGNQQDNTIIHNNFVNNQVAPNLQVSIDKRYGPGLANNWNDSTSGNYWSDYLTRYANASEADNTGTGNIPFVINENNIDYHPLMKPYNASTSSEPPTLTPTSTPTPTPTATSSPSPTAFPSSSTIVTPSPTIPEFPQWILLLIVGVLSFVAIAIKRRKDR